MVEDLLSKHSRPGVLIHRFRDHERECSDGSWDLRAKFYFPKASSDSNFGNTVGTG
jgi:hypothetical protein